VDRVEGPPAGGRLRKSTSCSATEGTTGDKTESEAAWEHVGNRGRNRGGVAQGSVDDESSQTRNIKGIGQSSLTGAWNTAGF
jgi:hypothetical protein